METCLTITTNNLQILQYFIFRADEVKIFQNLALN